MFLFKSKKGAQIYIQHPIASIDFSFLVQNTSVGRSLSKDDNHSKRLSIFALNFFGWKSTSSCRANVCNISESEQMLMFLVTKLALKKTKVDWIYFLYRYRNFFNMKQKLYSGKLFLQKASSSTNSWFGNSFWTLQRIDNKGKKNSGNHKLKE